MRRALSLLFIAMLLLPYANVSAKPVLDGAVDFIKDSKSISNETKSISLALMAMVESAGKVEEDLSPYIDEYVNFLLENQNPDGGWGYSPGQSSDVLDTGYAVVALSKAAEYYGYGTSQYTSLRIAADRGAGFIKGAFNGEAWGYTSDTKSEFYPTVIALWALGIRGYSWESSYMLKGGVSFLESIKSYPGFTGTEIEALKLISYNSIKYTPGNLEQRLDSLKSALESDSLSTRERVLATYALILYEGVSFDAAKALLVLEDIKKEKPTYWENNLSMRDREIVPVSSYATLSFALVAEKLSEREENPFQSSCEELKSKQNEDGGWSYMIMSPSSEKVTYYALKSLKKCYFRDVSIDRGLEWSSARLNTLKEISRKQRELYAPYVYALLTLAEFDMLSDEQKEENIAFIKSLKMEDGKWGNFLGPQPFDTALAIKALLALGVSPEDADIQKAKKWLLSVSKEGWGIFLRTKYYEYMVTEDVSTTLEVLEALAPISTKAELEPHIEWLLEQRNEDGGWPDIKENTFGGAILYRGESQIDLTIRVEELLEPLGYNLRDEVFNWIQTHEEKNILDSALKTDFLSQIKFVPKVVLYDVIRLIGEENFTLAYTPGREGTAKIAKEAVDMLFDSNVTLEEFEGINTGNYIVLADYNYVNISDYNPDVSLEVNDSNIILNGKTYERTKTMVLVPGKYEKGVILFVLYPDEMRSAVETFFKSGLVRYLKGKALVIKFEDKNNDGIASLDELSAEVVG